MNIYHSPSTSFLHIYYFLHIFYLILFTCLQFCTDYMFSFLILFISNSFAILCWLYFTCLIHIIFFHSTLHFLYSVCFATFSPLIFSYFPYHTPVIFHQPHTFPLSLTFILPTSIIIFSYYIFLQFLFLTFFYVIFLTFYIYFPFHSFILCTSLFFSYISLHASFISISALCS